MGCDRPDLLAPGLGPLKGGPLARNLRAASSGQRRKRDEKQRLDPGSPPSRPRSRPRLQWRVGVMRDGISKTRGSTNSSMAGTPITSISMSRTPSRLFCSPPFSPMTSSTLSSPAILNLRSNAAGPRSSGRGRWRRKSIETRKSWPEAPGRSSQAHPAWSCRSVLFSLPQIGHLLVGDHGRVFPFFNVQAPESSLDNLPPSENFARIWLPLP